MSHKDIYKIRELETRDYDTGFLDCLDELSGSMEVMTKDKFLKTFKKLGQNRKTFVLENTTEGTVVGTASLIVEQKFTHGCRCIG